MMNIIDKIWIPFSWPTFKKEEKFKLSVMMLGGRRTGKSSVLAAMQACFDEVLGATALKLSISDMDTLDVMDEKRQEIIDTYKEMAAGGLNFNLDANPTYEATTYTFDLKMTGSAETFQIEFVDLPGEWFKPNKNDPNKGNIETFVTSTIEKSNVLVIAIDTPYMMEDDGSNHWNENRNLCYRITQMIKNNMEMVSGSLPKMVLFVPLKCERYREEKMMGKVAEKILHCYGDLIKFLKSSDPVCEVLITPIFTMGTALFDHFDRDESSLDVIVSNGIPSRPLYYINAAGQAKGKPSPECCEQPMVCTIAYALSMAARLAAEREAPNNDHGPFYDILRVIAGGLLPENLKNWLYVGTYGKLASSEKFMSQINAMKRRLNDKVQNTEYGYYILSDPLKFRQ